MRKSWKKAVMLFEMCANVLKYDFQEMLSVDLNKQYHWFLAKKRVLIPGDDPFPEYEKIYGELVHD